MNQRKGLAKDKASIHAGMEKVQSYEEAFAQIQKATQITDIDELVRQGVDRFVVAPGARSAPLALACARDPHVRRAMRVVHDERAAAFYALGHARARGGSCACVVTTSGTAVANLLPAACEADRDSISIIFATADRPAPRAPPRARVRRRGPFPARRSATLARLACHR